MFRRGSTPSSIKRPCASVVVLLSVPKLASTFSPTIGEPSGLSSWPFIVPPGLAYRSARLGVNRRGVALAKGQSQTLARETRRDERNLRRTARGQTVHRPAPVGIGHDGLRRDFDNGRNIIGGDIGRFDFAQFELRARDRFLTFIKHNAAPTARFL